MALTLPQTGTPVGLLLSTGLRDLGVVNSLAGGGGASGTWPAANRALFTAVRLDQTRTYNKAWWINGATVSGNVDVGIYTISGTTATRIVASTAEAQATISVVQVATTFTPTTLTPGLYYLAMSCSSATATAFMAGQQAATQRPHGRFMASTQHPLPSSCTVVSATANSYPWFGFSELAVV